MPNPFKPTASTVNIDISASSQRVQVNTTGQVMSVYVYNDGTATAWIAFGDSTVTTATTTGMPIGTKDRGILELPPNAYVAAIAAGATGKIYFTPGQGGI
jgi:hypothetical protein